jgi:drug/metabolite transporter (DMT)-like permease
MVPSELSQDENDDAPHDDHMMEEEEDEEQTPSVQVHQRTRARWLLVGSAAIYGSSFPLIKLLNEEIPVSVNMPLRFGLASFLTLPWLFIHCNGNGNGNGASNSWKVTCLGLEVGLWNGLGYVSQAVGLETTEASKSAFIFSLAVIIVPLLDFIVGRHIYARQWIGALLAVAGCAFLELHGRNTRTSTDGAFNLHKDLTSYLQPLAFGIAFWRMERAVHKHPDQVARLTASLLLAIFISSAVFCAWSVSQLDIHVFEWNDWFRDWRIVLSLIYTGCVTIACTNYMETVALRTLTATDTTLILSVEPLFGTFFSTILVGEQLGWEFALGGVFILSACLYSTLGCRGILDLIACRRNNKAKPRQSDRTISGTSPNIYHSPPPPIPVDFEPIRYVNDPEDHPPTRLV